jgi:hypothetical protein
MLPEITPLKYWMNRAWAARAAAETQTEICAKEQMLGTAEAYRRRAHCDWGRTKGLDMRAGGATPGVTTDMIPFH